MEHFQIDTKKILFEEFEDETVLINADSGYYYSLSKTGTEILRLLQEGWPANEVADGLFGSHAPASIRATVQRFIHQLEQEEIIIASSRGRTSVAPNIKVMNVEEFVPPVLERFDDVRDLLLIDPVHQVDQDYGWPKPFQISKAVEEQREQ